MTLDESIQGRVLKVPEKEEDKKVLYTKKGTIRKRKPKTKNLYFTEDTEDAILEYLASDNPAERNKIYNERIWYGFHKLTENIIHTFKFYYTEVETIAELQHEVTSFLLEKLHLYQKDKGKAYSYFGTIAKRYLIIYNNNNYKKLKQKAPVDAIDTDFSISNDLYNSHQNGKSEIGKFVDEFIKYVDFHLFDFFPKSEDAKTADAIMELFRKRENLDIFNKKALYIYIREITDQETPQITKVIKKLKKVYRSKISEFYEKGYITTEK